MFEPSVPFLEIVIRGTLMYASLLLLLRGLLKREAGTMGIADLLMVVLLADAAQNDMASDYNSITDGVVLVGMIVFWNYALDWLGYHVPAIQKFLHPRALLLVRDGSILWRNMRREFITEEELMPQIRHRGIGELEKVREARIEGDGCISVIAHDSAKPINAGHEHPKQAG